MDHKKRWFPACALLLALALALAGCAGTASRPMAASLSAGTPMLAMPSERGDVLNALKDAKEDLKVITDLIGDPDLALLEEEDTSDTSEMTDEDITFYLGILEEYDGRIKDALTEIKARPELEIDEIKLFRTAEIAQFELAGDVVTEYMQVLHYIQSLLDLSTQMESIGQVDAQDPAGMYEAISTAINSAIDDMKSNDVPTFLQSMNDNMVASLSEMNDAVLYSLIAEDINDPLRRNAAAYRMGILERKFTRISADAETDTDSRMEKLKGDVEKLQEVNEGLLKWIETNLDNLGN